MKSLNIETSFYVKIEMKKFIDKMLKIIFLPLVKFNASTTTVKLIICMWTALLTSPMWVWIYKALHHIFPDMGFMLTMAVLITADLLLGIWKHLIKHDFDPEDLAVGLMKKVMICFFGMIIFNGITGVQELQNHTEVFSYFSLVGKMAVVFYIAFSSFYSMFYITDGKFPPLGFMRRMKKFEKTASPNTFTDKEEPNEENDNTKA